VTARPECPRCDQGAPATRMPVAGVLGQEATMTLTKCTFALVLLASACVDPPQSELGIDRAEINAFQAYRIINVDSGQCIDVPSSVDTDGTRLIQSPCHLGANQRWQVTGSGVGTTNWIRSGVSANNKCLGVDSAEKLSLWPCDTNNRVLWQAINFVHDPVNGITNFTNTVVSQLNSHCMDLPGGTDTIATTLQTFTCNSGYNQKWIFAPFP
jgi:hypothetical protein